MSVSIFLSSKIEGRKLSMVTCYDYTFARLLSKSAVDAILVGDSAAMVMHGHPSTLHAAPHGGGCARRRQKMCCG
jgi:3-methyl-2-oxobutanoate hydroxymethyltransferase